MARPTSRLQREIRQTKPFKSARQEAFLSILRTADILRRRVTRLLEPHGITAQQYNVLRILRGAGPAGLPTLAIGERLVEETPGMTRLLDRMETKQLVRRERCTKDRRQVLCYLTPPGAELLDSLDAPLNAADKSLLGNLRAIDIQSLLSMLDEIRAAEDA